MHATLLQVTNGLQTRRIGPRGSRRRNKSSSRRRRRVEASGLISSPAIVRVLYVSGRPNEVLDQECLICSEQVKADRGEIKDANATIKQLQEETVKAAEQERKKGN